MFEKTFEKKVYPIDNLILDFNDEFSLDTCTKYNCTKTLKELSCVIQFHNNNEFEYCKDSICNDLKLVLGSIAKGPNNKFIEREYKRTR